MVMTIMVLIGFPIAIVKDLICGLINKFPFTSKEDIKAYYEEPLQMMK